MQSFRQSPLIAELAKAGMVTASLAVHKQFDSALEASQVREMMTIPQPSSRNQKTSVNYEIQAQIVGAAEEKRLRRQSRNLANSKLTSVELI